MTLAEAIEFVASWQRLAKGYKALRLIALDAGGFSRLAALLRELAQPN